jgi:polysaccharide transporter, PST family
VIIAVGLASRSVLDKMLALRGGAELVALWAQLSSVIELVTGVAFAGVGTGIAVYVARTQSPGRQRDLLREALRIGLIISLPVALAIAVLGAAYSQLLSGGRLAPLTFAVAGLAGWVAIVPGLVNGYWLGQQRRDLMLALAVCTSALTLAGAAFAPEGAALELIALSQALPAVVVLAVLGPNAGKPRFRAQSHPLRRYVLPGLAVGLLSPASMLVARGVVGESLSWQDAGLLQALWRVSDWVCAFAAGVLSVHFLPRFAAARGVQLTTELRAAVSAVLVPSSVVLIVLYFAHRPLLAALYDPGFVAPDGAAALIFAGGLARIVAWIPLFALYAVRETRAIAIGELLSLPLFAALVSLAGTSLSLELVGAFWLLAYVAYAIFNFCALGRARS